MAVILGQGKMSDMRLFIKTADAGNNRCSRFLRRAAIRTGANISKFIAAALAIIKTVSSRKNDRKR